MKEFAILSANGLVAILIGRIDILVISLIIVLILDQITGLAKAFYNKNVSSYEGRKGIVKTVLTLIVIIVAHIADTMIGSGGLLRDFVIGALIANEGISILENAEACGVPIPKRLLDVLDSIKGRKSEKDNAVDMTNNEVVEHVLSELAELKQEICEEKKDTSEDTKL